jgi:DNA polymerase
MSIERPSILFRDIETRSAVDLTRVGAWRYAADPTTEVICVAYAINAEPVQLWRPGQPIPSVFFTAARDSRWLVIAHNDMFESALEQRVLGPRYGWPLVPTERHRCTMAMALASALPGSLEGATAALKLSYRKDADGRRLMLQMSKPRKDGGWFDDADRRERLYRYCIADVEAERALFHALRPLSPKEQALWARDAEINARGFRVDVELARAAQDIVHHEQAAIDAEIATLTDGAIATAGQVARISAFVRERGHQLKGLTKRSVSAVLARNPEDDVRRLLELRRDGGLASARKIGALLAGVDDDGRMRGTLRFHAASTGRWSGARFQPQNLKRPETENLDAAVDATLTGDLDRVCALGAPLSIIGDISRSMICAPPGRLLIAGDFSSIEARVLTWFADETWKLDVFHRFDATGDPALDPYLAAAGRILKRPVAADDEAGRQLGKICELAFGFGGGLGAWRRFDDSDTHTDRDVEGFKNQWRQSHPATTRFWRRLESAIKRTIRTRERGVLGSLAFELEYGTLRVMLPSGRAISYPEARIVPGKFADTTAIRFKDNARGGWADVTAWFGTFVENVVQGTARDLLAAAILRLEAAGYPIVLHVHDETVCEVAADRTDAAEFHRLMIEPPSWAAGLPIAAKVRVGERYSNKSKPQSEAPMPEMAPTTANIDESEKVYVDDF